MIPQFNNLFITLSIENCRDIMQSLTVQQWCNRLMLDHVSEKAPKEFVKPRFIKINKRKLKQHWDYGAINVSTI